VLNIVVSEENLVPTRGTEGSAGYDLYLAYDSIVYAGSTQMVGTGVKVKIPAGFMGVVTPRSSTGKRGLSLSNTVGIIDSDYTGEIMLDIKNSNRERVILYKYDKLFQLMIVPVATIELSVVASLEETERGSGGFGSTG